MRGPAHGPGPAPPHEQVCVLVLASPSLRQSWRDGLSTSTCVVPSTVVPHSVAGTMDPGGFQRHGPTLQGGFPCTWHARHGSLSSYAGWSETSLGLGSSVWIPNKQEHRNVPAKSCELTPHRAEFMGLSAAPRTGATLGRADHPRGSAWTLGSCSPQPVLVWGWEGRAAGAEAAVSDHCTLCLRHTWPLHSHRVVLEARCRVPAAMSPLPCPRCRVLLPPDMLL